MAFTTHLHLTPTLKKEYSYELLWPVRGLFLYLSLTVARSACIIMRNDVYLTTRNGSVLVTGCDRLNEHIRNMRFSHHCSLTMNTSTSPRHSNDGHLQHATASVITFLEMTSVNMTRYVSSHSMTTSLLAACRM